MGWWVKMQKNYVSYVILLKYDIFFNDGKESAVKLSSLPAKCEGRWTESVNKQVQSNSGLSCNTNEPNLTF